MEMEIAPSSSLQTSLSCLFQIRNAGFGDNTYSGDCLMWNDKRSVNIASEVIAIEQGMNLSAPHQKVGSGEFCHVRHVNVKELLRFRDIKCRLVWVVWQPLRNEEDECLKDKRGGQKKN